MEQCDAFIQSIDNVINVLPDTLNTVKCYKHLFNKEKNPWDRKLNEQNFKVN